MYKTLILLVNSIRAVTKLPPILYLFEIKKQKFRKTEKTWEFHAHISCLR